MGSYEHMIRGPSMDHASIALPNQLNTDARSGFVGRVESLKIVTTQAGATLSPLVKPETVDDWRFSEARTFQNPLAGGGGRNTWTPSDSSDTTRHDADGAALAAAGQHEDGSPVRHTVQDPASLSQAYITWQDSLDGTGAAAGRFGSDDVAGLGARLYHVLAYYRFNQDDRDLRYGGAYTKGLEWRYNAGTFNTATQVRDPVRHTHVQWSDVADATGALSIVQRRCHESDIISQTDSDIFTAPQNVTNRQRPYAFRSPREVGPQWRAGIVRPLAGQVPVSLIADWSVQTADRRFLIAATGRQLYWVKPLWEEDSPFNEEPNFAVWMQGWPSSHLFVKASASQLNLTGTASKSTIVFEGWLKPLRLDGVRMIAAKVTPATSQTQVSWCVYSNQGAIHVFGTESSGTRTWLYSESTIPGGATAPRLQHSLRSNVWNHLHVTIATAGVQVRVNGNLVDMTSHNGLTGTGKADAIGGGASDAPSGELYLGGLPEGRETLTQTFTAGASTNVVSFTPWAGYLTEVRILNAEDTAQWPTGQSGQPPGTRFVDTGTTYLLLHLNEGAGWFFRNSAANTTGSDAHSQVRECWPVMEGLEESSGHRYSWLIYRDRLLVSNGESRIQQLRFGALQDTNPITCTQLGMLPPEPIDTTVEGHTTVGTGVPPGTYLVAMTFTNADGTESEPIQLGSFVQAVAVSVLRLNLRRLPRSPDPQVTGRRLYASSPGGGAPLFNRQIDDNDGFEHDVIIYNGTEAVTSGDKVVPPRGRHLAVANASLLVADLTEEPAGQNAFAFGRSDEVSYFTVGSEVILDSFDGDAIIGARTNLGQVFISKARSVFQVSMGAIANANDVSGSVRLVNNSDGFGGGHCSSQNLIYGCGDRGVFVFDNANMVYLSQMIDRTWRQLAATTTIGLRNTYGLYNRNRSEVWISPRSETTEANNSILVLRLTGENAWSLLDVPEHSFMVVAQDDVRQQQVPLLGTTLGALLGYDDGTFIDHSDGGAMANGATTLVGSAGLSGSSTSLTMSGANFDTILGGLSGAEVEIVYNAGTLVRTIVRNTGDTLFWDEPLPGWVSFTSFTVGGYEGYWSSSWLSLARPSSENDIERIDLEMVPNAGVSGTLSITSIRQGEATDRAFPTDPAKFEQFVFDMSNGWLNTPEKPRSFAHGHYHRVKFGTRGIRAPFGLISVHFVGHKAMAAIGHAGKAS
jgi:hypothetical protein